MESNALEPSAAVVSCPCKDFPCEASLTSRILNSVARLNGENSVCLQCFCYSEINVDFVIVLMTFARLFVLHFQVYGPVFRRTHLDRNFGRLENSIK